MMQMPEFRPRKVDESIDLASGFVKRPILPPSRLPHAIRHALRRGDAERCGHCGEIVLKDEWDAHKRYCWFGGGAHPTWFKGCYSGNGRLRITDRQWAAGDRSIRR